jgi:hypothetical protein
LFLLYLLTKFQCFLPLPTFHMSQYCQIPRDHITWGNICWRWSKPPPCSIDWVTTAFNNLYMYMHALSKCS